MIDTNTESYLRDNIPVPVIPKEKKKFNTVLLKDIKNSVGRLYNLYQIDYIIKELYFRNQIKTSMFKYSGVYCTGLKSFRTGNFFTIYCNCLGCFHKRQLITMSESISHFEAFMNHFEFNPYLNVKQEVIEGLEKQLTETYSDTLIHKLKEVAKQSMDQEIDWINKTGKKNDKH